MRDDHFARSNVLNLAAMLSVAAPVALVFTGAGLHMGISGHAITLSAGVWSAIVCRVAATAYAPSHRAPGASGCTAARGTPLTLRSACAAGTSCDPMQSYATRSAPGTVGLTR